MKIVASLNRKSSPQCLRTFNSSRRAKFNSDSDQKKAKRHATSLTKSATQRNFFLDILTFGALFKMSPDAMVSIYKPA